MGGVYGLACFETLKMQHRLRETDDDDGFVCKNPLYILIQDLCF